MHSVRIVYDAWVAADAPEPRVVEVDGSTIDARWLPVADVEAGAVPTVPMVPRRAGPPPPGSAAAAGGVRAGRGATTPSCSPATRRAAHAPGTWTLPGGGVDHGETPAVAVAREVREETGLTATVGPLLGVHDEHFTGTAPHGREEDFHGVHLVFAAAVEPGRSPRAGDRRHHRRRRLGARWPTWPPGRSAVSSLVTAALEM